MEDDLLNIDLTHLNNGFEFTSLTLCWICVGFNGLLWVCTPGVTFQNDRQLV